MKGYKRWVSWLLSLAMAAALVMCLPVSAEAETPDSKIIACYVLDGQGTLLNGGPAIPVTQEGDGVRILVDETLYAGESYRYSVGTARGLESATYVKDMAGAAVFNVEDMDESMCYTLAGTSVGEKLTILGSTVDMGMEYYNATVTGYEPNPTADGAWLLALDIENFNENSKMVEPVAMVNDRNELVAILSGSRYCAFVEPKGGSSNEVVPAPTEAPAKPAEPDRDKTKDPGRPIRETEETKPEPAPEPEPEPDFPWVIVAVLAGAAAAAGVVLVVLKKRPKSTPAAADTVSYDIPRTMPVPETHNVSGGITICLVGVCGPLTGQTYPISGQSLLMGRAEDAQIRFPADTQGVSRRHCKILWHEGALMVMDLGSTSGTFLKGKGQLPANMPVPVTEGDVIYLGSSQNALCIQMR